MVVDLDSVPATIRSGPKAAVALTGYGCRRIWQKKVEWEARNKIKLKQFVTKKNHEKDI